MNPYFALGGLLALIASYGAGRCDGTKIETAKQAAAERAAAKAERQYQIESAARAKTALERETRDAEASTTIERTIERIVTQPGETVYRNVCWDADGVRAYNQAIALANDRAGIVPAPLPETGNIATGGEDRRDDTAPGH